MKISDAQLKNILREVMEGCGCAGCDDGAEHETLQSAVDSLVKDSEPMVAGHGGKARMARGHLYHIAKRAQSLHDRFDDDDELPEWVQSKLAVAESMINAVYDHMDYKLHKHEIGGLKEVRSVIKSAIKEAFEDRKIPNGALTRSMKTGAAEMVKKVPTRFNDEFVDSINSLIDMSQFDRAKFQKVVDFVERHSEDAREKAKKNEKPSDKQADASSGGEAGSGEEFKGF